MFTKLIAPLQGTLETTTALPVARTLATALHGAPVNLVRVVR